MSSAESTLEAGYLQLPDLFVRNETPNTITFNSGLVKWELSARNRPNDRGPLPWIVAVSPGFQRVWSAGNVTVARDDDFLEIIDDLPSTAGMISSAHVHRQEIPQSVVTIEHSLSRNGPVHVAVCSLDKQTEYWNFYTDLVSDNICRLTFADPLAFIATVS